MGEEENIEKQTEEQLANIEDKDQNSASADNLRVLENIDVRLTVEVGNAEICKREDVGLLAYSPLGFGVLSGKYRNGNLPEKSRLKLFPNLARFSNENSTKAIDMYYEISKKYNLSLTEMSLAFVNDRPFVTSNIIGATSMNQLKENINSINTKLSKQIISEINLVNEKIPNPAP